MSHATLLKKDVDRTPRASRRSLFKRDRPRAIDQYINYFGGVSGESTVVDPCGEALLDCFDSEEPLTTASNWR